MNNKTDWKDKIQYTTAVIALISGIALAFWNYAETGDITNGVLGYVAQMLVYAGSIFGVTTYWNGKYRETMNVVDARYSKIEKEILNGRNDIKSTSSSK